MTPFDRLLSFMTKPWVAASYFSLIAVCFLYLDQPVAYFFQDLDVRTNASIFNHVTKLALSGMYLVSFFILAILFKIFKKPLWEKKAWFMWLCIAFPALVCLVLKYLFGRSRPELLFSDQLYGFYGLQNVASYWSFPSGHTTTIMGLVFGLTVLFPKGGYKFIIFGLLVATTRILLVRHFMSDVLMASYLALLEVGILLYFLRRTTWEPIFNQQKLNGLG